jgi:hypothetical protein
LNEIIEQIEEDKKMPIVTSAEKIGIKKGKIEGKIEGRLEELHESIDDIWEIKFGASGLTLHEQLRQIEDIETLRQIKSGIKQAKTSDEARNIILARIADWQKN